MTERATSPGVGSGHVAGQHRLLTADELTALIAQRRGSLPTTAFGVVAQDGTGSIVAWTPAAETILNMTGDQMAGRTSLDPVWSTITGDGDPLLGEDHPAMLTLRDRKPTTGVLMGVRRGRTAIIDYAWMYVDSFPIPLPNGADGVATCFHEVDDITGAHLKLRHSEQMFRMITDRSHEVVGLHALDGTWLWASPATATVFGLPADDLVGTEVFDLIAPSHHPAARSALAVLLDGQGPVTVTIPMHHRVGRTVWVEVVGQLVVDPAGRPYQIQSSFRDVTGRILAEAQRDAAIEAMATIISTSPTPMLLLDSSGRIDQANTALAAMVDLPGQVSLLGASVLDLVHPDDIEPVEAERAAIAAGQRPSMRYVTRWVAPKTGRTMWVESLTVPIRGSDDGTAAVAEHITDITAERLAAHDLERRATLDPLTGLLNRAAFLAATQTALDALRQSDTRLALVFIDLDHFKSINDNRGHHVGDRVLLAVADRIRCVIGDTGWATRYGGDEFAVALPCTRSDADDFTARLSELFDYPFGIDDTTLTVSASVGSTWGHDANPETLLRAADRCMYLAKRRRRISGAT